MELIDYRKYKNRKLGSRVYCVSKFYIDKVYICDIMEDKDWGWDQNTPTGEIKSIKSKNKSKTAIPCGRYRVRMDRVSPKFSKIKFYQDFCQGKVPYLCKVPGFEGILMHTGKDERSSAGCLILGRNTKVGGLTESEFCFKKAYRLMREAANRGEEIWITIK